MAPTHFAYCALTRCLAQDLTGRAGATLDELGIPSNIVIDVAKQEGAAQMVEALPATSGDAPAPPRSVEEGEDAELQRALALSLEMAQPAPAATTAARESSTSAAGSSDLPLVRRVIPSDNSCLFTAVGCAARGARRAHTRALLIRLYCSAVCCWSVVETWQLDCVP